MKIAAVAIAKNEDFYIHEWIKYYLKLGFDDIFIYENDWRHSSIDLYAGVVEVYGYNVHFIPFDGHVMQLKAYNTFINEHGNEFDWAAFVDIDEFIVNNTSSSLKDVLERLQQFPQIGINWRLMGSNGLHSYDTFTSSVVKRFTRGDKHLNKHVKQIVNLSWFKKNLKPFPVFINPHCTNGASFGVEAQNQFFGPFQTSRLETSHALELYHYAVKTPEELHAKVLRGRADTMATREKEEKEYFAEHNKNDIELLGAKNFFEKV